MNIITGNIIFKGGWVMLPIILGSIIALGLVIERCVLFWRIRLNIEAFTEEIFFLIEKGEINRAIEKCGKVQHPIGAVFRSGLENLDKDIPEVERAMEREGANQVGRLEKNFSYLSTIIGVEPMLGFLGTIIGLIQAFMSWEQFSSSVTVEQLASGIYKAMITTAGGLLVAIPFYLIYNIFTYKTGKITQDLNYRGDKMLILLSGKKEISSEN